jgi:hypothetical protein
MPPGAQRGPPASDALDMSPCTASGGRERGPTRWAYDVGRCQDRSASKSPAAAHLPRVSFDQTSLGRRGQLSRLAEHFVLFGVGQELPDLLRAAAGDGDLGRPLQRLFA